MVAESLELRKMVADGLEVWKSRKSREKKLSCAACAMKRIEKEVERKNNV